MPMPRLCTVGAVALLIAASGLGQSARAAEEGELLHRNWSFDGMFGTFDRAAAQRGLQVYREVCSTCHSLKYIAVRNLAELGYSEDEVKAIAAQYQITDGPDDQGEMYQRPGKPTDTFPPPFPNEQAARAANGGALPPDLSLITKARAGGADYVYSLLQGYREPPAGEAGPEGTHYNAYFPSHWIAMPSPLDHGLVSYADGTEATVEQMAADVTNFLAWAAEPTLEVRKQSGLKILLFLIVLTALFYATKRKVWAYLH
jgi:ubiquinol-cytochrome c reductase cytochrome c1 subunit